jgi:hypothetical protein
MVTFDFLADLEGQIVDGNPAVVLVSPGIVGFCFGSDGDLALRRTRAGGVDLGRYGGGKTGQGVDVEG